jgi:putative nucleotidyltransferase with HDIG domain
MSGHSEEQRSHRWLARSRTGFLVSVASFVIPIALSVVAAFAASLLLPHPTSIAQHVVWWISILVIAWLAAVLGERIARPLLPLASLLKMSLLFPDQAPSRFAVAWRSGSTRQLDRYVHGLDDGVHREPVTAAVEILTLVTALSSHDRKTRGHSERVRAYTDLIADELRLAPGDRDRLRWSALLHDVGKITVHADILNKVGKPSETEWEILRQHPLEGQRILEPLKEWLGEWGLAVAQHHENFDGTGYPFGISGEQISLGARIVSVADAFEVMTSARSYKSPLSPSAARKELTRCAGTQFDPAIVRAFLDISVGRQRWVIGPLAWLFDVPIISQLSNLGNVVAVSSQVALVAGSVSLGAVAAAGQVVAHHSPHPHYLGAIAAPRTKDQPEVVAVLPTSTLGVAASLNAGATISHATQDTGGTVTYYVYRNNTCSSAGLIATLGTVKLTDGTVPDSPNWTAGPAGTYYFVAVYSGDARDNVAVSGCGAAPVTVSSFSSIQPVSVPLANPGTPTSQPAPTTTTMKPPAPATTTTPPAPATTTKPPAPTTTTTKLPAPTTTTTKPPAPTTTTTAPPAPTTTTTTPPAPTTTTTTTHSCFGQFFPWCLPLGPPKL